MTRHQPHIDLLLFSILNDVVVLPIFYFNQSRSLYALFQFR